MKFFTKNELKGVGIILLFIFALSIFNFRISLRRARDAQRKGDLRAISNALEKYHDDFGFFPPATQNGKIKACFDGVLEGRKSEDEEESPFILDDFFAQLKACEWGKDSLRDVSDPDHPAYLPTIPADPKTDQDVNYRYFSSQNRYQIYTYLEGGDSEAEYNTAIVERGVSCGNKVCSFGLSFGSTPLNKSIEEYELELLELEKARN